MDSFTSEIIKLQNRLATAEARTTALAGLVRALLVRTVLNAAHNWQPTLAVLREAATLDVRGMDLNLPGTPLDHELDHRVDAEIEIEHVFGELREAIESAERCGLLDAGEEPIHPYDD